MELTFSAAISAASPADKTLTGSVVPFGVPGSTSVGEVVFEFGSLTNIDPTKIKLLLEHDNRRPIGKAVNFSIDESGITGTFKVAETTAGTDALIEAAEGLRDGFSVGASADEWEMRDGVMYITAATLQEVSLVTNPAFGDSARVSEVSASEPDAEPITQSTEENTVEETNPVVVEEVVEASAPVVASAPIYASARVPSASELTKAVVMAARGDHSAQTIITAALDGATTSTAPGVVPVSYMRDVISIIDGERPFINSISRAALPAAGMTFKRPRWSSYPEVGAHTEGGAVASNPALIEDIDVNVVSRMGGNKISMELLDRSDPSYFDELRLRLADAYAINTDTAAITTFLSHTNTATGVGYAALLDGIRAVYTGIKRKPNRLLLSADAWATAMAITDEVGRPLFAPIGAQNSVGTLDAFAGTILGLNVVVDHNAPSGTAVVYSDRSGTYYEAAGSPATFSAQIVNTAELEVAVKGYDAFCEDFLFEVSADTFRNAGAYAINLD